MEYLFTKPVFSCQTGSCLVIEANICQLICIDKDVCMYLINLWFAGMLLTANDQGIMFIVLWLSFLPVTLLHIYALSVMLAGMEEPHIMQ